MWYSDGKHSTWLSELHPHSHLGLKMFPVLQVVDPFRKGLYQRWQYPVVDSRDRVLV